MTTNSRSAMFKATSPVSFDSSKAGIVVYFNGDKAVTFDTAATPTAVLVPPLGVVIMNVARVLVSGIMGKVAVVLEIVDPVAAAQATHLVTVQSDRTNVVAPSFRASSALPASVLATRPRAVICLQLLSS